jgi:hypothetical protein
MITAKLPLVLRATCLARARQRLAESFNIRQNPPANNLAYIRGSRVKNPFQLHIRSVLCLVKNYGSKKYDYIHKLDRLIYTLILYYQYCIHLGRVSSGTMKTTVGIRR